MLTIRRAEERGQTRTSWLESYHSFSFAAYHDETHMGFRDLRVINDDRVAPGAGFPPHGHRDMEIVTLALDGALAHKDSLGHGSVLRAGEVQRMSAGTGIRHSEFNASTHAPAHFLQIWILPREPDLAPGYEQGLWRKPSTENAFGLIASAGGREDSLTLYQNVDLYAAALQAGKTASFALRPERFGWLQVGTGEVDLNDVMLHAGDGVSWAGDMELKLRAESDAALFLFDLA